MDEFSAAQRLIGPTQVVVKQEDLELASEIVAAWRAYASEGPSSETPPPEDG